MQDAATPAPAPTPAPAAPRARLERGPVVLQARGIVKAFQIGDRSIEILHGVDLELHQGESTALVGASGAGKTTLLHVLGLLEAPTAGVVEVEGTDGWGLPLEQRARLRNRRIGFVFQFYHLLPELTAVENVLLPSMITHGIGAYRARRRELVGRAEGMLGRFGLGERLKHRPGELSGGERQRVALARALFNDPSILIADEPTGNLDSATGERILDLLFEEHDRRGVALLIVTHDERLSARCARTVHMEDGRVTSDSNFR
ncbi:MAG TPA: ABC transporter ATP-binding protein [Planctomycetota bacterium]|nr:ABC transporter ATP-binding protein [Planctomycetota bacterium]